MTEKHPSALRPRTLALGVITLLAVVAFLVTDDGAIRGLTRCVVDGGFARTDVDGRTFEREVFGATYTGTADNLIDLHVLMYGAYEPHVLEAMRDLLEEARPAGDAVAVDVGANVGTHSLFLAKHVETVHAVEPWPPVLDRLARHVDGLDNIVIHPVAFGPEEDTMPFHVPPGYNLGWGSFSRSYSDGHYESEDVIPLPVVVADHYLAEQGVERIDLVKIDIEGYEKPALEGFEGILERDRPMVFFELNVQAEEGFHSREELVSTFPDGYEFYEIVGPREFVWRFGDQIAMCTSAEYELVPFDMRFEIEGRNLVAAPADVVE